MALQGGVMLRPIEDKALRPQEDKLRCSCCGLPFARLQHGCIVVESKHSGEKHVNAVAVDELVKMIREEQA